MNMVENNIEGRVTNIFIIQDNTKNETIKVSYSMGQDTGCLIDYPTFTNK